ncbi:hypothetical protein HY623_04195 [Candidatus Uhrbacteria bacterium]|nr:hypothetical protein [Candidatus Uhrbacteria bacterium]
MHKKTKGTLAELKVASHLIADGWRVLFPLGENNRYDLVAEKDGCFVRIQVKYVTPKNNGLDINCSSSNNWSILQYKPEEIDYLAIHDPVNDSIYFIPVAEINKYKFKLRLAKSKNKQERGIHYAEHYTSLVI